MPNRAVILSGLAFAREYSQNAFGRIPWARSGTPSVVEILRRSGYETALFGKRHLRSGPWGFDYWKVGPGQGFYYKPVFAFLETVHNELLQ
jgi:arylsulfatase A-like enzyme